MEKELVTKIGKLYIKRGYQGNSREYPGPGFTSNVNETKRSYEDEPVTTVENERYDRRTVQTAGSSGPEYVNFVTEQLDGQVYEVRTTIKLPEI